MWQTLVTQKQTIKMRKRQRLHQQEKPLRRRNQRTRGGRKLRARNNLKVSKRSFLCIHYIAPVSQCYSLSHIWCFVIITILLSVSSEIVADSWEYGVRDALFTACKVGDVDALCRLLHLSGETQECSEGNTADAQSPLTLLNKPIDSSGFTLLHVASAAAQKIVVRLLLDAGADPAFRYEKNEYSQV